MYNNSKNINLSASNRNITAGNWCTYNTMVIIDSKYFTGNVSRFGDDKTLKEFRT